MKSDFELMARFKAGDAEAFHALARRHHVALHNFFFMLTGRESAALELTRGLFEQLVADRYRLPLERKFSTSLYRLGYGRWVAFEQSGGLKRHAVEPSADNGSEDPEKCDQLTQQLEGLRLLSTLPRDLRFLLVLSETTRLSFREIAEVLDISEEGVARRLTETLALLTGSQQRPALAAPIPPALPVLPALPPVAEAPDANGSGERPANKTSE